MAVKTPNFRGALMGFNKADVADYLARMESELEMYVNRSASVDKSMQTMRADMQNLSHRLETLTEENYRLETANAQLRKEAYEFDHDKVDRAVHEKVLEENASLKERLEALNAQLEELRQTPTVEPEVLSEHTRLQEENAQLREQVATLTAKFDATSGLRQECDSLRDRVAKAEDQGRAVQDALISAQRMRQIVLNEAQEEADRLTNEARQNAADTMEAAQQSANLTLEDARQRNEALQASYDRLLMDTSKMKTELIELYRRHLALLAEIPGPGEVPALEEIVLEAESE